MSVLVTVAEVVSETAAIRTLRLVRQDGKPFSPFEAGAHVDVTGPTGVLRQYSLCSAPHDPQSLLIAVKREPYSRGGSAALHTVSTGDVLKVGPPRNLLSIAETADHHLLVAGGIGVTPLLSMAYELHSRGGNFGLIYFARSEEEMAFADLLRHRVEFRDKVVLYVGVPRAEQPELLAGLRPHLTAASHVYTCGPQGFMDQVAAAFAPVVGDNQIHIEHFVAGDIDTSNDRPFVVEVDGETYPVPADKSILGVLEDNGIEVFKSCEEGVCGSCVSGVIDGIPDHRDHCLSAADRAANKEMALCVSRALSDTLVIELY
ncbi:PDR/VanB family oxidoreductase [Gordonia aichiensis]|uniref:Putative oxidoreductase n=1 Tax=Gordonia aichiensis NBRC 108223 TaxID=1220583 RepID=L7KQF0_9ACTN|nr:PDR/VanB family oxidoreductase [Gordonia aichiensis]GAC50736.1 putative oxidoreductase [Gordonia aichiensis NBRC 108223]